MRTSFVGHFAPLSLELGAASSAAGNQVQRQIAQELSRQACPAETTCYSMAPRRFWPRGPFISSTQMEGAFEFIGYVNLPVLKHLIFALRLLGRLLSAGPELCLQYNSYFFENAALLLYRLLRPRSTLVAIIQDIHVSPSSPLLSKRGLRSLSERASLRLVRRFDMIVPISSAIIEDFHMDPTKCMVFQGGMTDFGAELMRVQPSPLAEIGVFAGALEPHNGVDLLVERWLASRIERPLHIFGRGSLSGQLAEAAQRSEWIVLHGLQPESVILEWQRSARWNFCLRYSAGLDQAYFFPSKLFNILCAPGATVVNDFHALPIALRAQMCIVAHDLSDLPARLIDAGALTKAENVSARRDIVRTAHSWHTCISRVFDAVRRTSHSHA